MLQSATQNYFSMSICQTIRQAREALGISVDEFALAIKRTPQFVRQFESNRAPYDVSTIKACANALDLTVQELVELTLDHESVVLSDGEGGEQEGL